MLDPDEWQKYHEDLQQRKAARQQAQALAQPVVPASISTNAPAGQ